MDLHIDTSKQNTIELNLKKENQVVADKRKEVKYNQAELLLPMIVELLKKNKVDLKNLDSIFVKDTGSTFTSLRIGILTANALAFALKIPVFNFDKKSKKIGDIKMVEPKYQKEPNITTPKK